MPSTLANLGSHVVASRSLLERRSVQISIAVAAIATLLSIVLAPQASPSTWDWVRIPIVGICGVIAVLAFATAQAPSTDTTTRQQRLIAAAVLFAIALVLNLTFSVGTAVIFSIGITVVALLAAANRDLRLSWTIAAALIALIPFWVWSALQAWTWGLFLLVPLAAIAVISDGHMRAAVGLTPDQDSPLSHRAHRLACWAGILGSALIAFAAGLLTDASNGVIALGAAGAIALIALEAGSRTPVDGTPRRSVALADAALLWVALCWIVSL
jgi:hypothetical protein